MKRSFFAVLSIFIFAAFISAGSFAQGMGDQHPMMGPKDGNCPMGMKSHKFMGRDGHGFMRQEMMKKLNLTDQQKTKFADIRIQFQKKMIDLKADLQKSKLDLKELRVKGDVSRNDILNAVKKVNAGRDAIALATANHMYDMYEVLTPEQQKIWKKNAGKFRGMGRSHNMREQRQQRMRR